MARTRGWSPSPHDPLQIIDDNLWAVAGKVPGGPGLTRRMSIARRSDGKLVFHDSFAVDDATLAAIRALGEPAYQIVPNAFHCSEVAAFRDKLGVRTYAPAESMSGVQKRVTVDGTLADLPPDADVVVRPIEGTKNGEPWVLVRSGGGTRISLLAADSVFNMRSGGFILRLMGSVGPEVKVATPIFRLVAMRDKGALRASFHRLLDEVKLTRAVPCHGDVLDGAGHGDGDVNGSLRKAVKASLG